MEKVAEQRILQKCSKCSRFGVMSTLLKVATNVEIKKLQSSYYSVSYGPTALKIHHDTVYQKVGEQHI